MSASRPTIRSARARRRRSCATKARPLLIHQPSYSMLNRWVEEDGLLDTLDGLGVGSIAFSPLAQGMLTGEISAGHPRRQPRREDKVAAAVLPQRSDAKQHTGARRDRRRARAVAGADGACLGAAGRARHLGAYRSEPAGADRGLRRRAPEPPISARASSPKSSGMRVTPTSICGPRRPNGPGPSAGTQRQARSRESARSSLPEVLIGHVGTGGGRSS